MVSVISKPDTHKKLEILSADSQYDLACACSSSKDEHRTRGADGKWIYPVTLPNGGKSPLFKTLISNACSNDCKYCPLRRDQNVRRCTLKPEETVEVFLDYFRRRKVFGLFLSSGVPGSPDNAMEQLLTTARILRKKHAFKGYMHLKIIPGASKAAIEEALSLSNAVSLNVETPGAANLRRLSDRKDFVRDIIDPIRFISDRTARGSKYAKVKQTTQFIVGAAGEADAEIVRYMWGLYDRLKLQRIYFSAYQHGLGDESLAANTPEPPWPEDVFAREHRLYQVDFLFRKYGFTESDIAFDAAGGLSLETDPKELWARNHPEMFPMDVNHASRLDLLKVPGLGPITVKTILERRKQARLTCIEDIGRPGARLQKARQYLKFPTLFG